jgi:hypothetical protein
MPKLLIVYKFFILNSEETTNLLEGFYNPEKKTIRAHKNKYQFYFS